MSKKRRLFNEVFNAAMSALILLPALVVIQKVFLSELTSWLGVLFLCPSAICYPAGRLLRNRDKQLALTLGVVIAAACVLPAIIVFAGKVSVLSTLFTLLCGIGCGIALFLIPFISGSNLASGKCYVAGLILYVLAIAIGGDTSYSVALNTCAVVLLICGLFVFNLEGLRNATSSGGGRARYTKGMRRNNFIIIGIFVVLALLLANIRAIKDGAVAAGMLVVNGILYFLKYSADLNGVPSGEGTDEGSGSMDMSGLGAEAHVAGPLEQIFWKVLLYAIIARIIVVVCLLLYKLIRKLLARFSGLLDRLMGRLSPQNEDYIDETEDLDGEKEKRTPFLGRLRARFARRAKFSDMETNRARVRFAMREFLRKNPGSSRFATPNELHDELEQAAGGDFSEIYNRARYSTDEPSAEDAEVARRLADSR